MQTRDDDTQRMLELLELSEMELRAGRTVPQEEVFAEARQRLEELGSQSSRRRRRS